MKQLLIIALTFICTAAIGQNLVPNGIFNYSDTCSFGSLSQGVHAEPWYPFFSTPDYHHPCKSEQRSIPQNAAGYQNAHTEEGYLGLYLFSHSSDRREFYAVELNQTLGSGISYRVGLHISLADSSNYAINRIGLLLTQDEPGNDLQSLLSETPQIENHVDSILTDKIRWSRIEGSFLANGGERYLIIGNFHNDAETDTVTVTNGGTSPPNNPNYWNIAYYYIDNVTVIPDSVYLGVKDQEVKELMVKLYPNPISKVLTIESTKVIENVAVYDMFGRLVIQMDGRKQNRIDISMDGLKSGVYNVVVVDDTGQRLAKRILMK
jgi:hypothetical protein